MEFIINEQKSRVSDQEKEIDNLYSSQARAQIDTVERYKASSLYFRDMNAYMTKMMAASIALTKEWVGS